MRDKCQSGCWESVPNRHVLKTVPNTLQSAPVDVSSAADKMMAQGRGWGEEGREREGWDPGWGEQDFRGWGERDSRGWG